MNKVSKLAIAGVGLIGKQHVKAIAQCENVELSAIVDPSEVAKEYANKISVPYYSSLDEMFAIFKPDGIILATPNQLHVQNGMDCLKHNCPMIIEKPLATSSKEAQILIDTAKQKNIPILVGHHRRYNSIIKKAKEIIANKELGEIRAVHVNCWLYKPEDYFDEAPWRKEEGAGPISVNLAHDIDLIQYFCGDIQSVQAQSVLSTRGYKNEDVAVIILRFKNNTLGTITLSDTIVSPWSWELTSNENPVYPTNNESCYLIGGTKGSLSVPDLRLWQNKGKPSWWSAMSATVTPRESSFPLVNQIMHFVDVIHKKAEPLVSGETGFKTLQVIEAIQESAKTNQLVKLP